MTPAVRENIHPNKPLTERDSRQYSETAADYQRSAGRRWSAESLPPTTEFRRRPCATLPRWLRRHHHRESVARDPARPIAPRLRGQWYRHYAKCSWEFVLSNLPIPT